MLEAGVQQQRSQASANDQIATDGFERVFNDQAGEPHWWWSVELIGRELVRRKLESHRGQCRQNVTCITERVAEHATTFLSCGNVRSVGT